jgi:hypothetical protein
MSKGMGNPAIVDLSMKLLVTLRGRRHTPRRVFRNLHACPESRQAGGAESTRLKTKSQKTGEDMGMGRTGGI